MALSRQIESADTAHRKPKTHKEDNMFTQMDTLIPNSLAACRLDPEDARRMREHIEELLPEGEDRDLMISAILGRGDGLEDGWSGY